MKKHRISRRRFLGTSGTLAIGSILLNRYSILDKPGEAGIQLYTFRKEMLADPMGTLKIIADLGIKQIESARSDQGHYYGLRPKEMKQACRDLGMTLRSGHVHVDTDWKKTIDEAADAGQEYVICSSMPSRGQTVDNYKKVAEIFNRAGEDCKKLGLKFGYHNHAYEFETRDGQVLYDVLLNNTDAELVQMELDLGWALVGGKSPLEYFTTFPGRFPLWHLKDMDMVKKQSTEFGKGSLSIVDMFKHAKESGMKYYFVEQEEYAVSPRDSMQHNMNYLSKLKW